MRIRFRIGKVEVFGELKGTPTAKKVLEALPFDSKAQTWGEEVYFPAPVRVNLEADAKQVVDPGTVCFWTEGNCLALPFGPTPISKGTECRLVDKCNILGKLEGDPTILCRVRDGDVIRVEAAGGLNKT
ncbi:MAG: cyclophilin-like fold protein [Candidatus Omnitrophica bacterium]|nr:cyclophilin-like fold protein [Candidatus Omnitrophota bacterium]